MRMDVKKEVLRRRGQGVYEGHQGLREVSSCDSDVQQIVEVTLKTPRKVVVNRG